MKKVKSKSLVKKAAVKKAADEKRKRRAKRREEVKDKHLSRYRKRYGLEPKYT